MKSTALLRVSLLLFCFSVQLGPTSASSAGYVSHSRSHSRRLEGFGVPRALLKESPTLEQPVTHQGSRLNLRISRTLQNTTAALDRSCLIAPDVVRPGNTYNDPSSLRFDNVSACCFACEDDEPCVTWTYDRFTGACALKDRISVAFGTNASDDGRFVSSGEALIGGGIIVTTAGSENETIADARSRTVDASGPAPLNECVKETGVAYPGGDILRATATHSHEACCELCRNDPECFSWHRNANSRRCVLNKNVPNKVRRGGNYSGATVI